MVTIKQKNWAYFFIGGLLALVIAIGIGSVLAQTGDEATPTPETEETTPDSGATEPVPGFGLGFGRHRRGEIGFDSAALAEALGITVEELEAAKQEAREAAIAQAVADGLLTQEEADALLANGFGFGGRHGWHFGSDQQTYLAEALGISVDELQAAYDEVFTARLTAMVEAGLITQEQADLALARRAVQSRLDTEALQAAVQSAYEDAVAQALADGAITQEQADQLLSDLASNPFDFGPSFGRGFGHHGFGHGFGGFRGFGNGSTPDADAAPSTTDTGSDL